MWHGRHLSNCRSVLTAIAAIPGGLGRAYIAAAPPHKGVALMRRHRREGGVQCRVEATRAEAAGYSAVARVKVPGPRQG